MVFLSLLLGVAIVGGVVVGAALLSSRGTGSREGPSPNAPPVAPRAGPPPATDRAGSLEVPAEFGWARLNDRGEKSVGYYYRDRVAGRSFHVLFMESAPLDAAQLREKGYRGELTKRLGAHETMQIPEDLPAESAASLTKMMRSSFEAGGASGTAVLKLTRAERSALALPDHPPWIEIYLR